MDWLDDALCKGKHPDIWFPPHKEDRDYPESYYHDVAKMVCERCPVKDNCLELGREEEHGVWGGWTGKERRSGDFRPAKRTLSTAQVTSLIPSHSVGRRLDIGALKGTLKRYTERRTA